MNKPWNDSDLARLSADLDDELTAIFDQVEAALHPQTDPEADDEWTGKTSDQTSLPGVVAPDKLLIEEQLMPEDLDRDIDATLENTPPFSDPAVVEADWLEPELPGEPEMPGGLTPEMKRELSRMIEAAVEKGVATALAKLKG